MDVFAETGRDPVSKHQVQPKCKEGEDWRGTGRPNPSHATKFLGTDGDREIFIFPDQLTTGRMAISPD